MEAIMKAFEKMEKTAQRKQQQKEERREEKKHRSKEITPIEEESATNDVVGSTRNKAAL